MFCQYFCIVLSVGYLIFFLSDFNPSEVDHMSTKNSWDISSCLFIVAPQLNSTVELCP